jgi:hypothetical protein
MVSGGINTDLQMTQHEKNKMKSILDIFFKSSIFYYLKCCQAIGAGEEFASNYPEPILRLFNLQLVRRLERFSK